MKVSELAVLGLSAFLIFAGYNKMNTDTPVVDKDAEVILEYEEEVFPGAPTDPEEIKILNKLDSIIMTPEEALLMARAFQQWAVAINDEDSVEDLQHLALVHKGAAEQIVKLHNFPGFGGKLNEVVKELYNYKLAFLKKDGKIVSIELGPVNSPERKALQGWFNGLSWKMSEIFYNSIPNEA
jgi:hypothetical protein